MTDPVLASGQYSIDDYVFGAGTSALVSLTTVDPGTMTVQDVALVNNDGRRMGVDFLPGMAVTFTGQAYAPPGPATAFATMEALTSFWYNENVRMSPAAYSVLRLCYPGSPVIRRIYGRGRSIVPTLGLAYQGWIGFVAQFSAVDNTFYSDQLNSIVLGVAPAGVHGVAPPATPPLLLASQLSAVNLLPAADADFELPWTGRWVPLSLISALGQSSGWAFTGRYSMVSMITGAGTANFQYPSPIAVTAGVSYNVSAEAEAVVVTAGGTATVQAIWKNSGGSQIGSNVTLSSGTLSATAATQLSGSAIAPAGAASLEINVTYASPAAGNVYWDTWIVTAGAYLQQAALNAGTMKTWPIIAFTGPCTNPTIVYSNSSVSVSLQATLAAGQTAVIQTAPWNRSVSLTSAVGYDPLLRLAVTDPLTTGALSSSLAGFVYGSPIDSLALLPGSPAYLLYQAQDVTGNSQCTIAWRNGYRIIGGAGT
ncbi:MAG: hypothetical protein ACRDOK_02590 [Streptosporangiaceae bacterium]